MQGVRAPLAFTVALLVLSSACADGEVAAEPRPGAEGPARDPGTEPGAGGISGLRLVARYVAPGGPVAEIVSASADGRLLAYTSSVDATIGFLGLDDPARPVLLATVDLSGAVPGAEPTSVAVRPDGAFAVAVVKDATDPIARADPGALVVIDTASAGIVGQVALGVGPDSVKLTPDGATAVVAIEDEEDAENNGVEQLRPGSVQLVTLDYAAPERSTVRTIALAPPVGHLVADPQPEYVDVSADGRTAIVSLQENDVVAVIDLATASVVRWIDLGSSTQERADLTADGNVRFAEPFTGFLEPDAVCLLADGAHFVTANEGDTPPASFGPDTYAGGRGFSVFSLDGTRRYDAAEEIGRIAASAGAFPDARSALRGVELEGCATGAFAGAEYAFFVGERNSSLLVVDVSDPAAPVPLQLLGAPTRPESVVALPARNLVVAGGEGDGTGGGIWIYEAVTGPAGFVLGADVYATRSNARAHGALGALAWDEASGHLLAAPDRSFGTARIWRFRPDREKGWMELVSARLLRDAAGRPLSGLDPEGLAVNPEGGLVVAAEGAAGNGATEACVGSRKSNRLLFFDATGRLDGRYGSGGIVELPCGEEPQALDWEAVGDDGLGGVAAIDVDPAPGGIRVVVAFRGPLDGEERLARIGLYDTDLGAWSFYFYPMQPDAPGAGGATFLAGLVHRGGDRFAVLEADRAWAGDAGRKAIRTFALSSGGPDDATDPLDPALAVDLLALPFRFDLAKVEGLALGGGSLWVSNDNGGGTEPNYLVRLEPRGLEGR